MIDNNDYAKSLLDIINDINNCIFIDDDINQSNFNCLSFEKGTKYFWISSWVTSSVDLCSQLGWAPLSTRTHLIPSKNDLPFKKWFAISKSDISAYFNVLFLDL